jgi:hypothetical protein
MFIVQATGLLKNIRLGCKWLGSDRGISPQCFSANYCREKFYNTGPRSVSLTLVGGCEKWLRVNRFRLGLLNVDETTYQLLAIFNCFAMHCQ